MLLSVLFDDNNNNNNIKIIQKINSAVLHQRIQWMCVDEKAFKPSEHER